MRLKWPSRVYTSDGSCTSKMSLIALIIGVLGATTTVSAAEPSLQQQLERLQRQLEQQQRMIQDMQRQLDEQKTADEQRQREEQQIEQQATEAEERIAQQADQEVEETARVIGIDLSRETDRFGDSKGTQLKVPDTDTVLTLSGFIRGSAIHDFDKIASPTKFVTRDIVVNGQPSGQPDNRTTFTANASRFILGSSTPTERGKLSTFFSCDFNGNTTSSSADLRLRQAWGQLDNFVLGGDLRIGQAWTTWDDVSALPETMDFEGPNGSQQNRA